MTEEMNGEVELPKARMDRVTKALDDYEKSVGIPTIEPHSEAEQYLNMTHFQLSKLTAIECGEAAAVLAQYAFHLQRSHNKEAARSNWAEESTDREIAPKLSQYNAYSFKERRMLAVADNEYALNLDKIKSWGKARAERLAYLASKVEFLAKTMLELQQTKRRQ